MITGSSKNTQQKIHPSVAVIHILKTCRHKHDKVAALGVLRDAKMEKQVGFVILEMNLQ